MKYVKSCLIITMFLGVGYSVDCDYDIGDANGDGGWNVLDIVSLANCILAENCGDSPTACAMDLNGDTSINVLDIVILANCILAGNCGG